MARSGAWLRTQKFTPGTGPNPNLGDGPDPRHLDPVEEFDPFPEPTPRAPETPAYLYPQDDWLVPDATVLVTDPVDTEPAGHDVGGADRGRSLIESQALAGAAHSIDRGAGAVHHFEQPILREHDAKYVTQRTEADFAISGSRMQPFRGRNAYPENNPDGPPPQGHYVMRWIDRQFSRRTITPDAMPLQPYRAAVAAQLPPPAEGQANQYTSPYGSLAPARLLKLMTPQIRRVPRPPDDRLIDDGTTDPQYSDPQYWQGW